MKSSNKRSLRLLTWMNTGWGEFWTILLLSLIVFMVNILFSFFQNGTGFPLDDAWIHQTYARSIARTGTWAYSINEQSAGSTSPLWTLLLVPGFIFGNGSPFIWTFFISWLCLFGLALVCGKLFFLLTPGSGKEKPIFYFLIILEWHFVWAAGSGMETIIFAFGVVLVFLLMRLNANYIWIGLSIGLLACIRPDGITLLGPVLLVIGVDVFLKKGNFKSLGSLLLGICLPLLVYGYHNFSLSGSMLPNTYFAKSAEYGELLNLPLASRFIQLWSVMISGTGILLLPGFIWNIYLVYKKRDYWLLAAILWVIGFILLYAVRLPVIYQHGRYLMPVIPIYMLLGFLGTSDLINLVKQQKRVMYRRLIFGSMLITSLVFLFSGILAYSKDVKIINNLMVEPAIWLRDNTEPDAIIAAHDIGAIGFYSNRSIVDLAGLIDPTVVPIIRDEPSLAAYIDETGADYLVIFSDWYQDIVKMGNLVMEYAFEMNDGQKIVEIRSLHRPQD